MSTANDFPFEHFAVHITLESLDVIVILQTNTALRCVCSQQALPMFNACDALKANAFFPYVVADWSYEQTSGNKCHIEILRHHLFREQM